MRHGWQRICFGVVVWTVMASVPGIGFVGGQQDVTVDGLLNTMNRTLKLTEGQQKEITAVIVDYIRQAADLKAEGGGAVAQQEKLKVLRDQMDAEFVHYLTEEQMALWKGQRSQAKEKGKVDPKGGLRVPDGDKKNFAVGEHRPQNDSGVLESAAPDKIKTSGIW